MHMDSQAMHKNVARGRAAPAPEPGLSSALPATTTNMVETTVIESDAPLEVAVKVYSP